MKVGRVVGKLSLVRVHPTLVAKRYILTVAQGLNALNSGVPNDGEELVLIDELGAQAGDDVAYSEGGEAAAAFYPEKKPVDAYAACLIDRLDIHVSADGT